MNTKTWRDYCEEIQNKILTAPGWPSDQSSLIEIFKTAEKMGINPPPEDKFSLSKFRTIIKRARKAARNENKEKLNELIEDACNYSNVNLKLKIGVTEPEQVKYDKITTLDGEVFFIVKFRSDQFERMETSTKANFIYVDNTEIKLAEDKSKDSAPNTTPCIE